MSNHGPSYGLSRELQAKNQARFNIDEAQDVLKWIENVTKTNFYKVTSDFNSADDVAAVLKDGVVLCELINNLVQKTSVENTKLMVKYHVKPRNPFHKMENISKFLDACKAFGVPEISCFQTVDLYENKQCYKVIECLRSLAAVAQSKLPDILFPNWVVRLAHNKPRKFSDEIIRQGEVIIPLQYGTNKCASQKGMKPYGLARQINFG